MVDPKRPVSWSRDALADLGEIWRYYAGVGGSPTADNIIRNIEDVCRLLENHSLAGRSRDDVRPGLRSIAVRPHVLFYRVIDNAAEIVRVLDGRRDLDDIFRDEADRS
jgi:toxin ParE1/3/4